MLLLALSAGTCSWADWQWFRLHLIARLCISGFKHVVARICETLLTTVTGLCLSASDFCIGSTGSRR